MNDKEFKKKLETILQNLYQIDREVKKYLEKENSISKNPGYRQEPYGSDDSKSGENYKNEVSKIYNRKQ
jgi:hypothetical protein